MGNCVVELQNGTGWNLEYMWSVLTLEMVLHFIMDLVTYQT
jgi:hypothetical protein